jgi:glutathione-regulated potassium-efflux system protein KefB
MSVDVNLFLRSPLLVLGLAAGIVAVKGIILFAISKAFGYCDRADAGLFAVALSQAGEFAFVLFTAAAGLLPRETFSLLNAAVAVSMLTTPFLILGYERMLTRARDRTPERRADHIDESNPVIVAGFGRFGQVVVRVLRGLGIGTTVIDQDPGQIETVRRFGHKAYYGDATRLDLLESAGAGRAKLLLLAIDNPDAALAAVERIRKRFPKLEIIARARGRTDAYEYAAMGIPAVREVFGSAIDAATMALGILGYAPETAQRITQRFKEYDEQQLKAQAGHRNDISKLIALNEQGKRDIAQLLAEEARSAPPMEQ